MMAGLRGLWNTRSPRERAIIAGIALFLCAILYLWLLSSADRARTQLRASITTLRAQASRMERQAAELGRLRSTPPAPASTTDLPTLVRNQVEAAGLSSLAQIEVKDPHQVRVVFGNVPFADWLAWVSALQSQQVRLDSSRIEALSNPGAVSATATFIRIQQQ